jgi:WD40 repeat protein
VSAGWDKKLLIWDLDSGKLHDGLHNNNNNQNLQQYQTELAADGIILDMDYSKEMQSFAYSSGDYSIYLRRFSETGRGDEMQLIAVMQGHESEVNCVRWSPLSSNWISGGEDQSIRVWSSDGLQCLKRLSNEAPVHCLTVDAVNGCLITGSQDGMVRVFDPLKEPNLALCQRLQGHQHAVRSIVHLVERNQYLSASWDHTIHVWKAYFRKGKWQLCVE